METATAPRTTVFSAREEPPQEPRQESPQTFTPRTSVFRLMRLLTGDTRTLVRQEVQLAKTEISEKISRLGRNAAALAVGGFVAYAGLIVFLIGLGWLVGWALQKAGLDPVLANFIGLAGIGLVVIVVGCVLLFKGIKTISQESLAPQRTLHTLQELKGHPQGVTNGSTESKGHPSSEELQARVEATENRMGETLDELGYRLSPQHINSEVKQRIQANPYRAGMIAMGAGLLSGLVLRRKFRHA